jgi:hypothetical protein
MATVDPLQPAEALTAEARLALGRLALGRPALGRPVKPSLLGRVAWFATLLMGRTCQQILDVSSDLLQLCTR